MSRVPTVTVKALLLSVPMLCGSLLIAPSAALAQAQAPSQSAGLRTLTWPGKVERSGPLPGRRAAPAAAPRPALRGPVAAYAEAAPAPASAPSQGLTPASAWLRPAPAPVMRYDAPAPQPQPVAAPAPRVEYQPQPQPVAERMTAPSPAAAPEAAAADPMAPRRDAPIFRMQQAAARPPASAPAPAGRGQQAQQAEAVSSQPAPQPVQQGARYYSVHRAAGRQPDPTTIPEPFFLDAAPVDLAEPPAQPSLIRNANGRVQAAPAVDEPTLP